MSDTTDSAGDDSRRGPPARDGRGRPRKRLEGPPQRQEFASLLREQLFEPLRSAGWPQRRISEHLRKAGMRGASVPTLSRIASGERVPSAEVFNALLDLVGQVAGRPVPGEARQLLLRLRLGQLAVVAPDAYRLEILEQDNRRLRGRYEVQLDRQEDEAMSAEADDDTRAVAGVDDAAAGADDRDSALPYPVLALRADTAAHVEDVAAAGVPLPAGLMAPEPESTSTVLGVLYEIHDVLGHISRALSRALAEAEPDDVPPPAPSPMPSAPYTPPPALPSFDPEPVERKGCLVSSMTVVLVVVLLLLGYVYLVPFLKKQREAAEARESPAATITATATSTGGSTGGGPTTAGSTGGGPTTGGSSTGGSTGSGPTTEPPTTEPPEDVTGPTVSLADISSEEVGQEVEDNHGVVMQTCGPAGTPTTFSVWVAVSDPSGVGSAQLTVEHPTDGRFTTSGVADAGNLRFDVPAFRTGPRFDQTQQLQVSVTATDTPGNRTDTVLTSVTLYECGEPG